VVLLSTIDKDGIEKFAVFDGQQRLTSVLHYVKNIRSDTWPKRKNDDGSFRLEKLPRLKQLNGMNFRDSRGKKSKTSYLALTSIVLLFHLVGVWKTICECRFAGTV
jgi:hypothetical protein